MLVDAHLDIAYNALRGRNVLLPAAEQMPLEEGHAAVGVPDLRAGGATLICATIFCEPWFSRDNSPGYRTPREANLAGRRQLDWYASQRNSGVFRFVTHAGDLPAGETRPNDPIAAIILLEGADPILSSEDAQWWFDAGVRIVGLAWKQTRYAGGTSMPGPLTAAGVELVEELEELGVIHDTSHLAEESFWQLMDLTRGPVIASHSNCRQIIPTDRQLSDAMIKALAGRGGVIGVNFYDQFLIPPAERGKRRANLDDVVRQIRHMADLLGGTRNIGIGTDMDGGLGREQIPREINSWADLGKLADTLSTANFSDQEITGIMEKNWMDFFCRALPVILPPS
ncbi:MAG TPA: membrane dipeptidase [Tepidisphaeraceae bacterium]|nr:membrane dipeptidase [Tepidisphaeraceae bacterium]